MLITCLTIINASSVCGRPWGAGVGCTLGYVVVGYAVCPCAQRGVQQQGVAVGRAAGTDQWGAGCLDPGAGVLNDGVGP